MTMVFEDMFEVPFDVSETMCRFRNVEATARCVPGAQILEITCDGEYKGVITVKFGPKRFRFEGVVGCEFGKSSGVIRGRGTSEVKGARFKFVSHFDVRPSERNLEPGTLSSVVSLRTEAQLTGMLADFAKTGGVALAKVMTKSFAERFTQQNCLHVNNADAPEDNSISTGSLIKSYVHAKFSRKT